MTDALDIVERLRHFCTDWDGSAMDDHTDPMPGLHCIELREAADEITRLRTNQAASIEALRQIALALHEAGHTPKHGQSLADALRAALSAPAPAPAEAVAQCMSLAPEDRRPDFKCPDQMCGFLGQCRHKPVRGAKYAAPAAPAGWQWVPKEPTPAMVEAMAKAWQQAVERDDPNECIAEYRAALAAAPGAQGDAA